MQNQPITKRKDAGFTLVELAIVMIIIGLLIGGILKGQELINNARIAATVADVKGVSTAMNTFRDQYNGIPGDIVNATVRLPDCTADCTDATGAEAGNNRIGPAGAAQVGLNPGNADERMLFWIHLNRADLLASVDGTNDIAFGAGSPAADIGGGHGVGSFQGGTLGLHQNARGGNYLTITGGPNQLPSAAASGVLSASQAARFDRKLDDGSPITGSAFAGNATGCTDGAGLYDEVTDPIGCALYIRM